MPFGQRSPVAISESPPPAHSTPQLASANVLLIDSEVETAKLAPILRRSYRVIVSSNGATAGTFLGRDHVDVIITELQLADGSALDLCRAAKALASAPLILVTTEIVERVPDALEVRCDGVLLKPFAPNLLFARIGRMLRQRVQHVPHPIRTLERIASGRRPPVPTATRTA